ncbi:MAG: hypothetical protein ETSY2_22605 [Candidatus Entotheonella gemina]|uniref:Uncharacterized protein n=1 Tax=Candidatus Entotheonella gemina TaxID=1429439 RepID=W4M5L0_9BACT|nr:MAG: hypothetical protein ETSY2_22605 [Candidatus Entotheonella gemina]
MAYGASATRSVSAGVAELQVAAAGRGQIWPG